MNVYVGPIDKFSWIADNENKILKQFDELFLLLFLMVDQ